MNSQFHPVFQSLHQGFHERHVKNYILTHNYYIFIMN